MSALQLTLPLAEPVGPPRELILASAGSGKTFRISSRIIGLLAKGTTPETIFASTFTRKAAGEILERVLVRLAAAALDADAAAELAAAASFAGDDATDAARRAAALPVEPSFWAGVLEQTIRALHRLNIGTLDAFFLRSARTFANEVGLPLGWRIIDDETWRRMLSDSLQRVLRHSDKGQLVEIVRDISRERVGRSVRDALLRDAARLLALQQDLAVAAETAWSAFNAAAAPRDEQVRTHAQRIAARLAALPVPTKRNGAPNAPFARAMQKAARLIADGEWETLLCESLCRAAQPEGSGLYRGVIVPADVRDALLDASDVARRVLGTRYAAQARAHGRFARMLEEAVARRQRETGGYRFEDVTRALGSLDADDAPDLYYRLDVRTQHMLLDEFQDTSLAQWEALEPIADELLSGHEHERAAVIVADPKQSIYGWRGGTPLLVERVGERYGLEPARLAESWRSSQVVLDVVNRVFGRLQALALWERMEPHARDAAAQWARSFEPHVAKRKLPGHAVLRVGPADDGNDQVRPNLCRAAAALVQSIHAEAPHRTIGVLARTNAAVARIMFELRLLGVHASEEGGVPLVDAAPVAAVLALLHHADHPGDRVARYHVARSPLGEALGFTTHASDAAACRQSAHIRGRLVDDGYGATLAWLAGLVRGSCDDRERRRLAQLVELAFRYDVDATLRTRDFIAFVEAQRVEDVSAARVRVMTVHQAKGLEFDVVVLPQLDVELKRSNAEPLPLRGDDGAGRITHILPYVRRDVRLLFRASVPRLEEAVRQADAALLRDSLSALYVAITRARHALHMIVRPDGRSGRSDAKTLAMLVRDALAPGEIARTGDVLYESGGAGWAAETAASADAGAGAVSLSGQPAGAGADVRLLREARRTRALPRRSPSELEGGAAVELRRMLRVDASEAAAMGTIVHAWFEAIAWLEDGVPATAELISRARRSGAWLGDAEMSALADRFRGWLEQPAVRDTLSRARYGPAASELELERELPFLRREGDVLVEGVIDRLVVRRADGAAVAAEIVDFKTDAVDAGDDTALDGRAAFYRPQIEAYRRAVATMYRLSEDAVTATLVFVYAGATRAINGG